MALSVQPIGRTFAAKLTGIDLGNVIDDGIAEIVCALDRFAVCVVRHDTPISDEEHIAFSQRLGPVETRMRRSS